MTMHAIMVKFFANNITQSKERPPKHSSLMASILSSSHEIRYAGYNALLLKQPLAHNAAAWISNPIIGAADHRTAEFKIPRA